MTRSAGIDWAEVLTWVDEHGVRQDEAASRLGVTQGTVSRALKKERGGLQRIPRVSEGQWQEAERLREQGWTTRRIAERLGVGQSWVSLKLRHRAGTPWTEMDASRQARGE